jgi:hypothetical protein
VNETKREAYERWIDRLRKSVPIAMMAFGIVFVICANTQTAPSLMMFSSIGVLACIALTIALIIEYLIRILFFRPGRKLPWYQFSLSGMLILTTCVAAACALLKITGSSGIWLLILAILIFVCLLEWWWRKNK